MHNHKEMIKKVQKALDKNQCRYILWVASQEPKFDGDVPPSAIAIKASLAEIIVGFQAILGSLGVPQQYAIAKLAEAYQKKAGSGHIVRSTPDIPDTQQGNSRLN